MKTARNTVIERETELRWPGARWQSFLANYNHSCEPFFLSVVRLNNFASLLGSHSRSPSPPFSPTLYFYHPVAIRISFDEQHSFRWHISPISRSAPRIRSLLPQTEADREQADRHDTNETSDREILVFRQRQIIHRCRSRKRRGYVTIETERALSNMVGNSSVSQWHPYEIRTFHRLSDLFCHRKRFRVPARNKRAPLSFYQLGSSLLDHHLCSRPLFHYPSTPSLCSCYPLSFLYSIRYSLFNFDCLFVDDTSVLPTQARPLRPGNYNFAWLHAETYSRPPAFHPLHRLATRDDRSNYFVPSTRNVADCFLVECYARGVSADGMFFFDEGPEEGRGFLNVEQCRDAVNLTRCIEEFPEELFVDLRRLLRGKDDWKVVRILGIQSWADLE